MDYFLGIDASHRHAGRRLRGHRQRQRTTRSRARPRSRATSGTTPPRSTTRPPTPGSCTSTASSTARSPSAATSRPSRPASSTPRIGSALTSNGTAAGFFQGAIDEVRIWNVARTHGPDPGLADARADVGHRPDRPLRPERGLGTTAGSSVAGAPSGNLIAGATWTRGRAAQRRRQLERRADDLAQRAGGRRDRARATSVTLSATGTDSDSPSLTVSFFGRVSQSGLFTQIATFPGVASGAAQTHGLDAARRRASATSGTRPSATARRPTTSATRTFNTAAGADPVIVGVGDIADCTSSGDEATGALITGIAGGVFTTGDNVYTNGTAAEFANCYDPTAGAAPRRPARGRPRQPRLEQRQPQRLLRLLRRPGRRNRDLAVLQLRRRPVLARRRARQRLRAGHRRLRRELPAGAVAGQRPRGQLRAQRDRDVAPPALQLVHDELHRRAAVRRRALRRARRPRPRRP